MFPGVDKLVKGRVRAPSRSEAVLGFRQYTMAFPRSGDSGNDDADPELPSRVTSASGSLGLGQSHLHWSQGGVSGWSQRATRHVWA